MIKVGNDTIKNVIMKDENNNTNYIRKIYIGDELIFNKNYYILDGLVFHLDGINKGPNENAWTDLVGGVVFENHGAIPLNNGWEFSGNGEYLSSIPLNFPTNTSTIEIAFKNFCDNDAYILFQTTVRDSICFGIHQTNNILTNQGTPRYTFIYNKTINNTISCANNTSIQNMQKVTYNNYKNSWDLSELSYSYIGKRMSTLVYQNIFTGIIHSIRIYTRLLTEEEMMHNQLIDLNRFNF